MATRIEFLEVVTNHKIVRVVAEGDSFDTCAIYYLTGGLRRNIETLPEELVHGIFEKIEKIYRYGRLYAERIGATYRVTKRPGPAR